MAPDFVVSEIEQRSFPGRIAQKLIVLTGLRRLGVLVNESDPQGTLSLTEHNQPHANVCVQLRTELLNAGCPLVVIKGLSVDTEYNVMASIADVNRQTLRKAIFRVSTELLERMLDAPEWYAKRWVTRELQRRRSDPAGTQRRNRTAAS